MLPLAFVSQFSYASVIAGAGCDLFSVSLTSISTHDNPGYDLLDLGNINGTSNVSAYNASDCRGTFDDNDNVHIDSLIDPNGYNIGIYGSNLLNGNNAYFDGYEFIDPEADLQNLDDTVKGPVVFDDNRDDPGWIHLAKFSADSKYNGVKKINTGSGDTTDALSGVDYSNIYSTSISDLLTISFKCEDSDGNLSDFSDCKEMTWLLTTDPNIVQNTANLIGEGTFDHLAFSLKSGQNGFAVYDLNFKDIFAAEVNDNNALFGQPEAYKTAFILGGTIKMNDFKNKNGGLQGISHINVFARDPAALSSTKIPEPSTIAIFGLSLILLSVRRKQT